VRGGAGDRVLCAGSARILAPLSARAAKPSRPLTQPSPRKRGESLLRGICGDRPRVRETLPDLPPLPASGERVGVRGGAGDRVLCTGSARILDPLSGRAAKPSRPLTQPSPRKRGESLLRGICGDRPRVRETLPGPPPLPASGERVGVRGGAGDRVLCAGSARILDPLSGRAAKPSRPLTQPSPRERGEGSMIPISIVARDLWDRPRVHKTLPRSAPSPRKRGEGWGEGWRRRSRPLRRFSQDPRSTVRSHGEAQPSPHPTLSPQAGRGLEGRRRADRSVNAGRV